MGVACFGVLSSNFTGIVVTPALMLLCVAFGGGGETELGNAPGIYSSSRTADSLTGAVRGVRAEAASCDSDTLFGVDEFLFRRR